MCVLRRYSSCDAAVGRQAQAKVDVQGFSVTFRSTGFVVSLAFSRTYIGARRTHLLLVGLGSHDLLLRRCRLRRT